VPLVYSGFVSYLHQLKPTKIHMTTEQFIEEARQLARPVFHLTKNQSNGAPLAAYWGGSPLVTHPVASDPKFRHWLSIDCRFLPARFEDLKGCLSVYANENEEEGIVAVDASMQIDSTSQSVPGLPLFAHPATSWPPIEAIFKFGSPAFKQWHSGEGHSQNSPEVYRLERSTVFGAYDQHLRMNNPLLGWPCGVYAALGGWSEPWPENDWYDLQEKRLVLFTYEDAEPYIEVWLDDNHNFQVIQRIS